MTTVRYDLIIIGSGPGGEVAAIRAAQLGWKVALVEKNEHLGGTCLNVGCIPTKCLLESAKTWTKLNHASELGFSLGEPKYHWDKIMSRKEGIVDAQRKGLRFLMKKNKVDTFHGVGQFRDANHLNILQGNKVTETIQGKYFLIATGSKVRELPFAKSNGKNIETSDTILFIDHVPKTLAVIGGGVVGMEFASLFGRFGTQVTVVEMAEQVLPFEDPESVKELVRHMTNKQNVTIKTKTKLLEIKDQGTHCVVKTEGQPDLTVEKVLVSIGREPVTDLLGLDKIGLKLDAKGFIPVDSHYQTAIKHVFAIGDVIATPALAHTASAEAIHAVEIMTAHKPPLIDYEINPSAIYTYPEVASIGKTEPALKSANIPYKVAKFPFAPLAKAKIEEATEGFVKILISQEFGEILGAHIVGARATELIGELALGKALETTIEEIGYTIHPHPTISETIMEAAHAGMGGAIHL